MPKHLQSRGRRRAVLILLAVLGSPTLPARASAADPLVKQPPFAGRWEGAASTQGKRFPLWVDIVSGANGTTALIDYPDVPVYAAPFEARVDGDRLTLTRNPAGGPYSRIEGTLAGERLSGSFTGAGAQNANLELVRRGPAPTPLRETALRFDNAGVRLSGTLVLPQGSGPFPAVVVSHGSGPGHRGQASYRTEAFRYARQGIAALIYDKRGCGESGGDWTSASLEDLARDALAGLKALRALPDIRADRIGVAGHSQGGWIAPLAATLSPDVAFVIATSASALDPMAQSLHHNANEMRAAGFAQADIDAAQDLRGRLYDGVRAGTYTAELERDLTAASKQPWFEASQLPTPRLSPVSDGERRLLLFDPLPVWRKVRVPVLAIWGADDINLPATHSRDLIARELAAAGNGDVTLHVLPGLTHGFMRTAPADAPWDFPRGEPKVEALLADWLRKHLDADA